LGLFFLQQTWKEPPQGSSESKTQFISRAGYSIIEYTNSNQRRGIQFRVAARLEPFLHQEHCHKLPFVEILTIQVCDMVFVRTYIPDGRTLEGIQKWIATMDTLEASFPNKAVVALGDLNSCVKKEDLPFRNSPTSFGPRFKGVRNTAVLRSRTTSIDAGATGSSPGRAWTVSSNPCFKPRKRVNKTD